MNEMLATQLDPPAHWAPKYPSNGHPRGCRGQHEGCGVSAGIPRCRECFRSISREYPCSLPWFSSLPAPRGSSSSVACVWSRLSLRPSSPLPSCGRRCSPGDVMRSGRRESPPEPSEDEFDVGQFLLFDAVSEHLKHAPLNVDRNDLTGGLHQHGGRHRQPSRSTSRVQHAHAGADAGPLDNCRRPNHGSDRWVLAQWNEPSRTGPRRRTPDQSDRDNEREHDQ